MPIVKPSLTSPNVGNLSVKRGYMSAQFEGEAEFTDMGFCAQAELTMNPTLCTTTRRARACRRRCCRSSRGSTRR